MIRFQTYFLFFPSTPITLPSPPKWDIECGLIRRVSLFNRFSLLLFRCEVQLP